MDILDHIATYIQENLGAEIFTEAQREQFLVTFRAAYGKDRPYVYSLTAMTEQQRVTRVLKQFKSQLTTREIAEREGISQRRVQQIVARNPVP